MASRYDQHVAVGHRKPVWERDSRVVESMISEPTVIRAQNGQSSTAAVSPRIGPCIVRSRSQTPYFSGRRPFRSSDHAGAATAPHQVHLRGGCEPRGRIGEEQLSDARPSRGPCSGGAGTGGRRRRAAASGGQEPARARRWQLATPHRLQIRSKHLMRASGEWQETGARLVCTPALPLQSPREPKVPLPGSQCGVGNGRTIAWIAHDDEFSSRDRSLAVAEQPAEGMRARCQAQW
jgi:hypothetical protein